VARHQELVQLFTGGDPGIRANLERVYADKANWPATFKNPFSDKAQKFLKEAERAHGMSCA
jgi:hypothetical protein